MSKDWQLGHGNFDPYDNVPPLSSFLDRFRTVERKQIMTLEQITRELENAVERRDNIGRVLHTIKNVEQVDDLELSILFDCQFDEEGILGEETEIDMIQNPAARDRARDYLQIEHREASLLVDRLIAAKRIAQQKDSVAKAIALLADPSTPLHNYKDELLQLRDRIGTIFEMVRERPPLVNTNTDLGGGKNG